ncbi:MAG: RluA family pseudouridine synthase [Planctomycetota bacterium]
MSKPPNSTPPKTSIYHATSLDELEEAGAETVRYTPSRDAAMRLDKYLCNRLKGMSRNQVQRLIDLGGVTVNGSPGKPSLKLKAGDTVDVVVPPKPASDLTPEDIPLDVLYEDDAFIAVNKHADIIVHPARGRLSGTMLNALLFHFQKHGTGDLSTVGKVPTDETGVPVGGAGGDTRPGVIHRLDRFTTGVIVFAKQDEAHWLLAQQWERRTNLKAYLAVVHGNPTPAAGVIDQPLGKHPTIREAHAVRHDATSKHALTLYRVREQYKGFALVEFELKTGRTHQIRVHAAYIGHPLVGDILYGGEPLATPDLDAPPLPAGFRPNLVYARPKAEGQKLEAAFAANPETIIAHPALHAGLLQIVHPITRQPMTFTAPLHEPMRSLVHHLRERHDDSLPTVTNGTHIDLTAAALPI